MGFTGVAPPPITFAANELFQIGHLRHVNKPTSGPSPESVDLTISLLFSDPEGLIGVLPNTFRIVETSNDHRRRRANADRIIFETPYAQETFILDSIEYTLELVGFGRDPENFIDHLCTPECGSRCTLLWGKITTSPVPEPATLFLLGSGLVGMIGLKKRKKSA